MTPAERDALALLADRAKLRRVHALAQEIGGGYAIDQCLDVMPLLIDRLDALEAVAEAARKLIFGPMSIGDHDALEATLCAIAALPGDR